MGESVPTIPEYFAAKNIFITGGTGFIGKVLVEKLLRSCPNVGRIYLLIRINKNRTPEDRIKNMTDIPLFDLLKEKYPDNLKKIVPILGDVGKIDLGISTADRKTLIEEVNIVYHAAASIRFNDPLRDAIIMNARGTREVVKLCKEMKGLDVFCHVSTMYCNTDKQVVDEEVYPAHVDWRQAINVAESVDPHLLEALKEKYIHPHPNTYTFAKLLAEQVVKDLSDGQIPAIIYRPSIVISTMLEPVSGWTDNLNGPIGVMVAGGKGIIRTLYANPDVVIDSIPCDVLVKGTIIATWKKGIEKDEKEKCKLAVYNGRSHGTIKEINIAEMIHIGKTLSWEIPFNSMLWYPHMIVTKCWYLYYIKFIFYQLLPALFVDSLLVLLRKKAFLVKIQRRNFASNAATHYFLSNEWVFINKKSTALEDILLASDREAFSYQRDHAIADPYSYAFEATKAAKKYLLKEPDSVQAKINSRRMWLLAQAFNAMWYYVRVKLLCKMLAFSFSKLDNMYLSFHN